MKDIVLRELSSENFLMEQELIDYIMDILSSSNGDEICESVPPLLLSSGRVKTESEADELCYRILSHLNISHHLSQSRQLETPIQIDAIPVGIKEDLAYVPNMDRNKHKISNGNSYEVENYSREIIDELKESDRCENIITYHDWIHMTNSVDAKIRKKALGELCPCRIKRDCEEIWTRIIEMTKDINVDVRYQALHNLCDGSPNNKEDTIIKILEEMQAAESDKFIKRKLNLVLTSYRYTGKWNIL